MARSIRQQRSSREVAAIRRDRNDVHRDLHLFGHNGMHKYPNQDHAMITAMLAARSVLAGARLDGVWKVNEDAQDHEAGHAGMRQALDSACLVPTKVAQAA